MISVISNGYIWLQMISNGCKYLTICQMIAKDSKIFANDTKIIANHLKSLASSRNIQQKSKWQKSYEEY